MTSASNAELLRRVTAGDLAPEDDEVVLAAANDPDFARAVSEVRELQTRLDAVARLRASDLARAAASSDAVGSAGIRAFVETRVAERRRARMQRRVLALVAAAAILVLVWFEPWDRQSSPILGPMLGDVEIELREPVGEVASFETFRWESGAVTGWFVVHVVDGAGKFVAESGPLELAKEWQPGAEVTAGWPAKIWWEVQWWDGSGSREETKGTWAWR